MALLDAREQLMLELLNRARMDPLGEAKRFGINLNQGFENPKQISSTPKQVLAGQSNLETASAAHSTDMLAKGYFAHDNLSKLDPGARMAKALYGPAGSFGWGENIAWSGSTGSINLDDTIVGHHRNLFLSAGHRYNILKENFEELGVGSVGGTYKGYNALMTTQNFGYDTAKDVHITGVHYADTDKNNFYSVGEGQASRSVKLYKNGVVLDTEVTSAAGGYAAEITYPATNSTAIGLIEVVFSGGGLSGDRGVFITVDEFNAKVDLVNSTTIATNFTATLSRGSLNLTQLGIQNITGNGNAAGNLMNGNAGHNVLRGYGGVDSLRGNSGNDTLVGGDGNDHLYGGAGSDIFRFDAVNFDDDRIFDFVDGTDKLSFAKSVADSISDFSISGNGSSSVLVSLGADSVLVAGTNAITLTSADFLFV